ncbi:MAG: MarR family transcriptional regulator, organic hydroperoxide resistance regulator [Mycobacterium sp.]|jgi:DNA-binding MarR family transcriptional regulator|nr:MarR family transcriptional regulator, organic hydroperoxide resistance regulator [Mycobacterium sp.]
MAAQTAPDLDPLALEHQVCFALSVTNRAVLAVYRPLLEPLGLTHPQYLVMLTLWDQHGAHQKASAEPRKPQKPLSVKEIAAILQLDSATLSPMLKRLAALGLITRTRSATDERSTDVRLTESGTALRQRALKIPPAVIARLGVDITELQHLHEVLTRINSAALAAGALES